jgi:single-stranded-DNA-specific exonuclease
MPLLIARLLSKRGIAGQEATDRLLRPSLKALTDPFQLKDMQAAVERLIQAQRRRERVLIYADYDLDGSSGLALMLDGLSQLGFQNVRGYQPRRLTEGYGLKIEALKGLIAQGLDLIVTVDLGITAVDEVHYLNSAGCEIIVTDHHLPGESLPTALAVVNPNRSDDRSGLGHLCGAGVAFFLLMALRKRMSETEDLRDQALRFDIKSLLDLFAIGTVTDMVPLVAENRVLVKHGLRQLEETRRPGLRLLLERLNLVGQPLGSQDLAIRFAPKLNALSRMERGLLPIDVLAAPSRERALEIVDEVLSNNQVRQDLQKSAELEAQRLFLESPDRDFVWVWSDSFHRGVIGLVATRLCQDHGRPAFVGSLGPNGQITGSARWPNGVAGNLVAVLNSAASSLHQFGGHAQAAGFELSEKRAEDFRELLRRHFAANPLLGFSKIWEWDVEAQLHEVDAELMRWFEILEPFGQGFPTPQVLLRGLHVREVKALKGAHWRISFCESARKMASARSLTGVWFSVPEQHPCHPTRWGLEPRGGRAPAGLSATAHQSDLCFDALVEIQWNYFRGERTLQLLVKDLRFAEG